MISHGTSGLLTRTRWELGLPTAASPPELLGGEAWLYPEARVVVLVDLRRGSLMWSEHALRVLDCVLSSVSTGPSVGSPSAGAPTVVHVTVALGARQGWPMRVLVQGYCLRCGDSCDELRQIVHEQLRLALGTNAKAAHAAASVHGLHECVRDGLFCLNLLPSTAAPALAVLTDAVGAALDAPLLGLRQLDVTLLVVLCLESHGHQSAGQPWNPSVAAPTHLLPPTHLSVRLTPLSLRRS